MRAIEMPIHLYRAYIIDLIYQNVIRCIRNGSRIKRTHTSQALNTHDHRLPSDRALGRDESICWYYTRRNIEAIQTAEPMKKRVKRPTNSRANKNSSRWKYSRESIICICRPYTSIEHWRMHVMTSRWGHKNGRGGPPRPQHGFNISCMQHHRVK